MYTQGCNKIAQFSANSLHQSQQAFSFKLSCHVKIMGRPPKNTRPFPKKSDSVTNVNSDRNFVLPLYTENGAERYSEQSSQIIAEPSWPLPGEPTIRGKLPQARGVYPLVRALPTCQRYTNNTFQVSAEQWTVKHSPSSSDRCETDKLFLAGRFCCMMF